MAIGSDFSVASNGDIRYTGGGTNYTGIEFYRWLGTLMASQSSSGDDLLDITIATAADRSTDEIFTLRAPFNIDQTVSEHLYDCSITQNGGADIWDGIVCYAPPGMYLNIIQNGALAANFWTTGLNADAANGISHRFLLKTRTAGVDIDGRRLIGDTREFNKLYSYFPINGTGRGKNVLALSYDDDPNNQTAAATVAGWVTITNVEGYQLLATNDAAVDDPYYSQFDRATFTINQLNERLKWLTRRGSTSTLYGVNGGLFRGITHQVGLTTPRTGTFAATELVSWGAGATAGTGIMVAIDSTTVGTKLWIQLTTGVIPSASVTITGGTSAATATNSGSPVERAPNKSTAFHGSSTGTSLNGAYGVGVKTTSLSSADKLTDLNNALKQPPNYVTLSVFGLVVGEDEVYVGPESAGAPNFAQFALSVTLNGAAETAVVVGSAIPSDTPATGKIRIEKDTGARRLVSYTSWTSSTFTIASTDFSGANAATAGNDVSIAYIDKLATATTEAFTTIYSADRALYVRVRDGGAAGDLLPIKTYETTVTLGSAGGSVTVSRLADY